MSSAETRIHGNWSAGIASDEPGLAQVCRQHDQLMRAAEIERLAKMQKAEPEPEPAPPPSPQPEWADWNTLHEVLGQVIADMRFEWRSADHEMRMQLARLEGKVEVLTNLLGQRAPEPEPKAAKLRTVP